MRRGAILTLVVIALVVALVTTAIAYFIDWLPEQASEERQGIDFVLWLTIGICIFVFAIVAAVSIYAGFKFRARPDDDSDGPPIHGHTGLEILWTAVPTVLVTIIAVASAIVLAQNDRASGNPIRVNVRAQQFAWSFEYPDHGGVRSTNLHLPIGRSAKLYLRSEHEDGSPDVIHAFWVPEFGQKQDVVPGIVTTLIVTPTKLGEYRLICAELCGLGHALMRSRAIVMSQADFGQWLRQQRRGTGASGPGGEDADAEQLFTANCGSCHTLDKARTEGTIGPNLNQIRLPTTADVEEQIRDGGGGMPAFGDRLSDDQIELLVQYLTAREE